MKKGNLVLIVLLFIILVISWSCSKEDISITDVPLDELEYSFVKLAPSTVEIYPEELSTIVIQKDTNQLVVVNDPRFSNLKVGDHIVTSIEATLEQMIFRKVLSITQEGNNLRIDTEGGKVLEAYTEFHIDFSKPGIISTRDVSLDLSTLSVAASSLLTTMFSSLSKKGTIPFRIETKVDIGGSLNLLVTHPHTLYIYKVCRGDISCLDPAKNPGIDRDSDGNGVYDVVQNYYNSIVFDAYFEGFYEFSLYDFQIKKFEVTVSTSQDQSLKFELQDKPGDIVTTMLAKQNVMHDKIPEDLNYSYIAAPGVLGPFGLGFAIGPVVRNVIDVKAYLGLLTDLPSKLDIKLGYVDYIDVSIPSFIPSIEVTQQGKPANFNDLLDGGRVDLFGGLSGKISGDTGLALGPVLTFGEPNTTGGAIGGMIETTMYKQMEGLLGFKFRDVFSIQESLAVELSGYFCLDVGVRMNAFLFTDVNWRLGGFINDFFDNKIVVPKNLLPSPFSIPKFVFNDDKFKDLGATFLDGKGICAGDVYKPCVDIVATELNISLQPDNTAVTSWKIDKTTSSSSQSYSAFITHGTDKFEIGTNLQFGTPYFQFFEFPPEIMQGFIDNILSFEVIAEMDCNIQFPVPFIYDCGNTIFEDNPSNNTPGIIKRDIQGETILYMSRELATAYCGVQGKKIIPYEELNALNSEKCIKPTGYYLSNGTLVSTNKSFAWVGDNDFGYNIAEIVTAFNGSGYDFVTVKDESTNISTLAPCLCF